MHDILVRFLGEALFLDRSYFFSRGRNQAISKIIVEHFFLL